MLRAVELTIPAEDHDGHRLLDPLAGLAGA
jgi:hypothetical protein